MFTYQLCNLPDDDETESTLARIRRTRQPHADIRDLSIALETPTLNFLELDHDC